jgi:hypothetical protein
MIRTPFTWDNANFSWESNPFGALQSTNPFIWNDVALLEELAQLIQGGAGDDEINQHLKKEKKKKQFVTLWCTVQGIETKTEKEIKDFKVKVSDVELVLKEVFNSIKIEL